MSSAFRLTTLLLLLACCLPLVHNINCPVVEFKNLFRDDDKCMVASTNGAKYTYYMCQDSGYKCSITSASTLHSEGVVSLSAYDSYYTCLDKWSNGVAWHATDEDYFAAMWNAFEPNLSTACPDKSTFDFCTSGLKRANVPQTCTFDSECTVQGATGSSSFSCMCALDGKGYCGLAEGDPLACDFVNAMCSHYREGASDTNLPADYQNTVKLFFAYYLYPLVQGLDSAKYAKYFHETEWVNGMKFEAYLPLQDSATNGGSAGSGNTGGNVASTKDDNSSGLSDAAIGGIVVGGVGVLIIVIVVCICCKCCKKTPPEGAKNAQQQSVVIYQTGAPQPVQPVQPVQQAAPPVMYQAGQPQQVQKPMTSAAGQTDEVAVNQI